MTEPLQNLQQLTDTERIAVALFGWVRDDSKNKDPESKREYHHPPHSWEAIRILKGVQMYGSVRWPDLTDWNTLRRMEDALEEKGLLDRYDIKLWLEGVTTDMPSRFAHCVNPASVRALRATAQQRVAAAVKTLEEAGL